MKGLYSGADRQLIELVIGQLMAKPDSQPAAPAMEVVKNLTKTVAKRPAPPAPKVYVQRVEVYRGRARIKGGICKELRRLLDFINHHGGGCGFSGQALTQPLEPGLVGAHHVGSEQIQP
jgi:hypothetical protein